jgi:hypothetical protein
MQSSSSLGGDIKRSLIISHAPLFWTYNPVTGVTGLLLQQKKTTWNSFSSPPVEPVDFNRWMADYSENSKLGRELSY